MKILIVCQYYYPEQFQINEIAPELVKRGHQVTVLTGLPNYPLGEIYKGYENAYKQIEVINGVNVVRVKARPRKTGTKNLILNYVDFVFKANKKIKSLDKDFDIVISYQLSPVLMALPAIKYAKKYKKPLYLYCLDIWPESCKAHVKNEKGLIYSVVKKVSKSIYKKCDKISVTSKPFINYLNSVNGISLDKLSYIPQHADKSYLSIDFTNETNGVTNFTYAGNIGSGQKLDTLILAVNELKAREDFILNFVGDGSAKQQLEGLVKELNLENKVVFLGNQKREDMPKFYKQADALLISLRGDNFVGNTLPGKFQAYMSVGKPIFGAINGAIEITNESGCGKCVNAGDYKALASVLEDYLNNPKNYENCGKNARDYFSKHFTLDKFIESFEKEIKELVK